MRERILIAGSGGQGIVLIGKFLATMALDRVPCITFFPAYGAEVRGGMSHCQVILASEEIPTPVAARFDSMLVMTQASAAQFLPRLEPSGLAVVNASLCQPAAAAGRVVAVRATETAEALGDVRAANFVMLGAFLAARPLVPCAVVEDGIRTHFGQAGLADLNLRAFQMGGQAT